MIWARAVICMPCLMLVACAPASNERARAVAALFPSQAERVLAGPGFTRGPRGFEGAPPSEMSLTLPSRAHEPTVLRHAGFAVELVEATADGESTVVEGAVAYVGARAVRYWVGTPEGYEEWLLTEHHGGEVSRWRLKGGQLQQTPDGAQVLDEGGTPRLRVSAPDAFLPDGTRARAWLEVVGDELVLLSDAEGEQVLIDPGWSTTGALATSRWYAAAAQLFNGRPMVCGGVSGTSTSVLNCEQYDFSTGTFGQVAALPNGHASAQLFVLPGGDAILNGGSGPNTERYTAATNSWAATNPTVACRNYATQTPLADGRIMLAGGFDCAQAIQNIVEIFNPATGNFSTATSMGTPRWLHTATRLNDGRVLVVGGANLVPYGSVTTPINTAEIYNPSTNLWAPAAGTMVTRRFNHAAVLLPNGNVAIYGGSTAGYTATANVEIFNVGTSTFSAAPSNMGFSRTDFTSTLLPSGRALVVGGIRAGAVTNTTELYDTVAGTWSSAGTLTQARTQHNAVLMPNGKVLIAGGSTSSTGYGASVASAEVYDPQTPAWAAATPMSAARAEPAAAMLANGELLVAGGSSAGMAIATAARYVSGTGAWAATGSLVTARFAHTLSLLPSGAVLAAGGRGSAELSSAELYSAGGGTWVPARPMLAARQWHQAVVLANGRVLVAGGSQGGVSLASAELYEPSSGEWLATGAMTAARSKFAAVLLPDGRVLAVGGVGAGGAFLNSAELYDPVLGTWSATGSMSATRSELGLALLASGRVLVAGGTNAAKLASAELYTVGTGTWAATGAMTGARSTFSLVPLLNGSVLAAAGSGSACLTAAEMYDPARGVWVAAATVGSQHAGYAAALLPTGRVLVAGGTDCAGAATAAADVFDEGRGVQAGWAPTLAVGSAALNTGASVNLTGTHFYSSVAVGGGDNSHAANSSYPFVALTRLDTGVTTYVPPSAWSDTTASVTMPSTLQSGWYAVRVVVNGAPSPSGLTFVTAVGASPNGTSCTVGSTCQSGNCSNGVCCNTACGGSCDVCTVGLGASADGTCTLLGASATCRAAAGTCDVAETCTGASSACPVDGLLPAGSGCRPSVDLCDVAESCTGSAPTCPTDGVQPNGFSCRAATGLCDIADTCDGVSTACADGLRPNGFSCRASVDLCDVAETCSGASASCPLDGVRPNGFSCRATAGLCDVADTCDGASTACADVLRPNGFSCRAAIDVCDAPEVCTGSAPSCPADALMPASTPCRSAVGLCDAAETCSGSSTSCPADAVQPAGTVCRPAVDVCDAAEVCSGSGTQCPADALKPLGTPCRAAVGVCDVAEVCSGAAVSCPVDAFVPASTECRASTGVCDEAEACPGDAAVCPANQPPSPLALVRDATLRAEEGLSYQLNAAGAFSVMQARGPVQFSLCGPLSGSAAGFSVEGLSGAVTWVPQSPGVASLCVQATDGCTTDQYRFDVVVLPKGFVAPVAKVSCPSTIRARTPFTCSAELSTADSRTTLVSYRWAFDDGVTFEGPTATRAYVTVGWHAVTLEVVDGFQTHSQVDEPLFVQAPAPFAVGCACGSAGSVWPFALAAWVLARSRGQRRVLGF